MSPQRRLSRSAAYSLQPLNASRESHAYALTPCRKAGHQCSKVEKLEDWIREGIFVLIEVKKRITLVTLCGMVTVPLNHRDEILSSLT